MSNDFTLSLVITMLFMKHKNINTKITAAEITAAVVLCQKVLIFYVYKEISTIILYQNDGAYMVEARGIEPLSESVSTGLSPGAVMF